MTLNQIVVLVHYLISCDDGHLLIYYQNPVEKRVKITLCKVKERAKLLEIDL